MSQREKCGFNWYSAGLPVPTCDGGVVSPATSFSGIAFAPCMLLRQSLQSRAAVVGHAVNRDALVSVSGVPLCAPVDSESSARGVGHAVNFAAPCILSVLYSGWSFGFAVGLGHPIQALSAMRCADAVCAQYASPDGVTFSRHVCVYSIEPTVANRAFNLLAKDDVREALLDEICEHWP